MLNSTLTATERTLCCILENYQTPDGVRVPPCLQPYMMGARRWLGLGLPLGALRRCSRPALCSSRPA
jgi:hypothetical protein